MVILYSNNCPNCQLLEAELHKHNVNYTECTDIDTMIKMGLNELPVLEFHGKLLSLNEAVNWLKKGLIT